MPSLVVVTSLLLGLVYSAPKCPSCNPCIPANTCFPVDIGQSGSLIPQDDAVQFSCSSTGAVNKVSWKNNANNAPLNNAGVWDSAGNSASSTICSEISTGATKDGFTENDAINSDGSTGGNIALFDGITTDGSGSGVINTDYLQGTNCPLLDSSSDSCTDYMVIKRYGNKGFKDPTDGEELAYQDIGRGTNGEYEDALGLCRGKGTGTTALADYFVIPVGCVRIGSIGSNDFWTNGSHFGWDHWNQVGCTGVYETAQSDSWVLNECGVFAERTHCGGNSPGDQTICSTGGVLVTYDYYFEALCMPDQWRGILGLPNCQTYYDQGQSNAPTTANQTPYPTKSPNDCPACPSGTPSPTTKAPTTSNPTDSSGTGKPTNTPDPTTSTARPTTQSPTTANPTDSDGTGKPTTTPAPTNKDGSYPTPKPTAAGKAIRIDFIISLIIGFISAFIM